KGRDIFPTASLHNLPNGSSGELVRFLDRILVVTILEVPGRPHRHGLGQLQRLQHEELRFSDDDHLIALDCAIRDLAETLFGFADRKCRCRHPSNYGLKTDEFKINSRGCLSIPPAFPWQTIAK